MLRSRKHGALSTVLSGWRVSGVQSYASGFPLSVGPGYGLPPNGGDNRITAPSCDYLKFSINIRSAPLLTSLL